MNSALINIWWIAICAICLAVFTLTALFFRMTRRGGGPLGRHIGLAFLGLGIERALAAVSVLNLPPADLAVVGIPSVRVLGGIIAACLVWNLVLTLFLKNGNGKKDQTTEETDQP